MHEMKLRTNVFYHSQFFTESHEVNLYGVINTMCPILAYYISLEPHLNDQMAKTTQRRSCQTCTEVLWPFTVPMRWVHY